MTLNHHDHPHELEEKHGGWLNPIMQYVFLCVNTMYGTFAIDLKDVRFIVVLFFTIQGRIFVFC